MPDLGPLNPNLAGVNAELRIHSRSFDDIYGEGMNLGAELAYGMNNNAEVFGSVSYMQADEGRVRVGGAFVPALDTALPVYGTFGEYKIYALEAGYRQYFGSGALKPYVAGRLDAAITIANAPFYDSSTSFTAGVDVGLSCAFNDRVSLQAETRILYISSLNDDDSAIGGPGLASINGGGDRSYVPVTLRAKFAF